MKRRAIRNAFARLGMQSKPGEVVAALTLHGIVVSEDQVRAVLMEMLRDHGVRQSPSVPSKRIRRPQKVIPRRNKPRREG